MNRFYRLFDFLEVIGIEIEKNLLFQMKVH